MVIINFFLAACKGDSLLYHCNCKGHDLLGTTIAGVIINYTLGLASSHYNSGPGWKLARGCWLTDRVFSKGGKPSSFGKSDRVFSIFVWSGWSGRICGLSIASRSVIRLPVCLTWPGGSVVAVWPLSAGNWGCNRAFLLLTYYIGYVGHVPGGDHEFLDAFLRPASYCK